MNELARTKKRSPKAVRIALRLGLGLWISAGAVWAALAMGELFQIGKGSQPAIATGAPGHQVMVWQAPDDDGDLHGRLRDARGRAIGVEFRIRSGPGVSLTDPDVTYLRTGDFVVAWERHDGDRPGIFARRFHRRGRAIGVEFRIDEAGRLPALGADDREILVVAWTAPDPVHGGDRGSYHFVRRFDREGRAIGVEFRLGDRGPATTPALAVREAGGFLVVWENGRGEIVAQAFDTEGTPLGDVFRVNESRAGNQASPDVTVTLDGSYTVVWERIAPGQGGHQVFGRRISAAGRAIGVEFQVSESRSAKPTSPTVTADHRGRTLVAWISQQGDILAREVALESRAIGVEFRIDAATPATSVRAAPGGTGDFVVIWESDESGYIYGRDLMLE